jgi:hypothetical protein
MVLCHEILREIDAARAAELSKIRGKQIDNNNMSFI